MEKCIFFVYMILLCALTKYTLSKVTDIGSKDDKIVGGHDVTIEKFPYQAILMIFRGIGTAQCGGSIISPNYILTAAHCLPGALAITARIGSADADFGGMEYNSFQFMGHPAYNSITADYDVAYVRTLHPMVLDGVRTRAVGLAPTDSPVEPGTIFIVSGWGADMEGGNVTENLKAVEVPVIPSYECRRIYKTITPRMICAGVPEGGIDSCQGDSGGPAITEDGIQRGIVSYGYGCARKGFPGVYTNVSAVRNWIFEHTGI